MAVDKPLALPPNDIPKETTMVYLQINLDVAAKDRPAAAAVYSQFKAPFLAQVAGAKSKELLIRDEEVQVLHGFGSVENAQAYIASSMFQQDVVTALGPLLQSPPEVRVYTTA
jgi:hypothetical protein